MNEQDGTRAKILQYFYDRNASATSMRGKKGSQVKIGVVKTDLKRLHGLSQSEVISNLNYLLDKGWMIEVVTDRDFRTAGGVTVSSDERWYHISSSGIDRIEGDSEFKVSARYSGINITSISGVVSLGDGNVINAQFAKALEVIRELRTAARASKELSDEAKLDLVSDIDTIEDQFARANPNRGFIATIWSAIEKAVTGTDLVMYAAKAAPYILEALPT